MVIDNYVDCDDDEFEADEAQICLQEASTVRERAYCPYSKFKVGAAIITAKGKVYTGCNVENASYGLSICAERSAMVKAASEGDMELVRVAVCAESSASGNYISPCGACRQFLAEFISSKDVPVYLCSPSKQQVLVTSVKQLLPLGFSKVDL